MLVKAKPDFELIIDATIGRPRKTGETWEVDEERAKLLLAHRLIEIIEAEPEKPKKRGRKKKNAE